MIAPVREEDLADLLPLLRGYCDFYEVAPGDEQLLSLCRALIAGVGGVPYSEGVQLLARDDDSGEAIGFATLYWTWTTLQAGRLAVMNDLFVAPEARGTGVADALIAACRDHARGRGAVRLEWQTARDNHRAQKVYDRAGGEASMWISYGLTP